MTNKKSKLILLLLFPIFLFSSCNNGSIKEARTIELKVENISNVVPEFSANIGTGKYDASTSIYTHNINYIKDVIITLSKENYRSENVIISTEEMGSKVIQKTVKFGYEPNCEVNVTVEGTSSLKNFALIDKKDNSPVEDVTVSSNKFQFTTNDRKTHEYLVKFDGYKNITLSLTPEDLQYGICKTTLSAVEEGLSFVTFKSYKNYSVKIYNYKDFSLNTNIEFYDYSSQSSTTITKQFLFEDKQSQAVEYYYEFNTDGRTIRKKISPNDYEKTIDLRPNQNVPENYENQKYINFFDTERSSYVNNFNPVGYYYLNNRNFNLKINSTNPSFNQIQNCGLLFFCEDLQSNKFFAYCDNFAKYTKDSTGPYGTLNKDIIWSDLLANSTRVNVKLDFYNKAESTPSFLVEATDYFETYLISSIFAPNDVIPFNLESNTLTLNKNVYPYTPGNGTTLETKIYDHKGNFITTWSKKFNELNNSATISKGEIYYSDTIPLEYGDPIKGTITYSGKNIEFGFPFFEDDFDYNASTNTLSNKTKIIINTDLYDIKVMVPSLNDTSSPFTTLHNTTLYIIDGAKEEIGTSVSPDSMSQKYRLKLGNTYSFTTYGKDGKQISRRFTLTEENAKAGIVFAINDDESTYKDQLKTVEIKIPKGTTLQCNSDNIIPYMDSDKWKIIYFKNSYSYSSSLQLYFSALNQSTSLFQYSSTETETDKLDKLQQDNVCKEILIISLPNTKAYNTDDSLIKFSYFGTTDNCILFTDPTTLNTEINNNPFKITYYNSGTKTCEKKFSDISSKKNADTGFYELDPGSDFN